MYGGGRQSITICCLIIEGKLPIPDFTIIADTEREKETTWVYLDKHVRPHYPKRIYRIKKSDWATVDLYGGKDRDTLLIPAFTNVNGALGKMETFCSNEWKARVCDRFLKKQLGIRDWISWIGFSVDEPLRYNAKRRSMGDKVWFPLVDGIPMTKEQCASYPQYTFGWPEPVHLACWMCPLQDDVNWDQNTPSDAAKARQFDRNIRRNDPNVFLHRQCVPLSRVNFFAPGYVNKPCDSGLCMT